MKYDKIFFGLLVILMICGMNSEVIPEQANANLYKVYIRSQTDADAVADLGVNAICRTIDGYLIHTIPDMEPALREAGITFDLVAVNIIRDHLAVRVGDERFQTGDYPVVYEESGLRLCYVDPEDFKQPTWESGIAPLLSDNLPITFRQPPQFDLENTRDMVDLDSLASCVLLDSCSSYVHRLQDFQTRWVGTDSNYASRDWLIGKFTDFGYDSIIIDTFMAGVSPYSLELATCHSVVAYKVGTEYPDHHIVIGAHRDSYPIESPGADDNASGSSGVLEIARVLSGFDTKMTIVFVLFDAEETGLFGSWHFANRAVQNGDSIVLMINMDVIGYYENTDTAMVGYAPWCSYGDLWADLADSLPSINLITGLYPEALWDGEPFQCNGYDAISVYESEINPNLHGAHDSTTYVNFDYMTRIVRGCLVTAYVTDQTYIPAPMLQLSYPGGTPDYLYPNTPASFEVLIEGYAGGTIAPGTEYLNYAIDGGTWDMAPLSSLGGGLYQASLPALPGNSHISFYVSAEESGGGTCYSVNPDEPHMIGTGLEAVVIAQYDFEDYTGWITYGTANHGLWSPWRPQGGPGGSGQVPIDHDGSGWCYVTGPKFDVDDGTTMLKSPSIDMTGGQVLVEYARWFSNSTGPAPYSDIFEVYISGDDGGAWTNVETVGPVEQSSGGWFVHRFWVNDIIDPTAAMRLRFDASDEGDDSRVEGGVDAVTVTLFSCGPQPEIITESIGDWTEDYPLSLQLESTGGFGAIAWDDTYDDLTGTGFVLESDGLLHGISYAVGPISFTATITDEFEQTDQQAYSFTLNPAVYIVTESLPRGMIGNPYSYQLTSNGGTGDITWIDIGDSLAGSGLSLSPDGLISGTPLVERWRYFTIRATDEIGALDEKSFLLNITPFYVCGDANGDGACNVGDAVFIIKFVFGGGPVPEPIESGDANGDGQCNIGDTVYIINFVFSGGPPPQC